MDKLDQLKDLIADLKTEIRVSETILENKVSKVALANELRKESNHIDVILEVRKNEFYVAISKVKEKVTLLDKELSNLKLKVIIFGLASGGIGSGIGAAILKEFF